MHTATPSHPRPAGRREWVGLFILSVACLVYSMDLSVLFLATPAIVADLDPTAAELLWINDIYGFMVAGFLVTMGTLGDRIGRRRVLLAGAAAFAVASLFAALASTAATLILARTILGIAGATVAPSTLSLIVNLFPVESERTRAIGIWGTAFALGGLVGPLIGGLLLQFFPWGSVFLINIPVMLALLVAGPFLLPEYRSVSATRLDLVSVALSLGMVLPVIWGLKETATEGLHPAGILAIVAGFGIGTLFVRRQGQLADPLIDLSLFRIPAFTASLLVNLGGVFVIFGVFLFQNQYLQLVLGFTPLEAALWSIPPSLVFTVMSLQAWRVTKRFGPVPTVLGGLLVHAAGTASMGLAAWAESLPGLLAASALIGIGFVPVVLTTTGLIVGAAPPERAGAASAIAETGSELGGALGVALLGSLGTLVYRLAMSGADLSGLDPADTLRVRATLGGAVERAHTLGLDPAPAWLTLARDGFSDGFALMCVVAAAMLVLLAGLARLAYAGGAPKAREHG